MRRSTKPSRGKQQIEPSLFAGRTDRKQTAAASPVAKKRRRSSLRGYLIRFSVKIFLLGIVLVAAVFGHIWMSLDRQGLLKIPEQEPGILIIAANGSTLAEQGSFNGDDVRISDLPDYVPNAFLAIEDRRFRSHYGVDPIGVLRALYANYREGRLVQGGSTLTQQLAKNLFLTPERTIERKLQEAVLAIWLETKFSKDEILQLYLNRVYFGAGAVGIEKAAQVYYQKPAADLTLAEAATLAGVVKAPSAANPISNPGAAAARAKLVIEAMVDAGFITDEDAARLAAQPAEVNSQGYLSLRNFVVDWVKEQLPEFVRDYDQSLVVETTIDLSLQAQSELVLTQTLTTDGAKLLVSEGALVMMDGSGAVLAMVGGKSYKKSQFNRATKARRQPGSAFKPFVFLAALERGFTPQTMTVDEPVRIGNWRPENYRKKYLGPVSLETALALSLNTVAAKLVMDLGPDAVAAVAHRLGITSPLGKDASIALGTSEVTLLELTSAFAPFSNGGYPVVPYVVTRVRTRDGMVVYERNGPGFSKAISDRDLSSMNRMMRLVVTDGTGNRAAFPDFDIAGKTGTSQDYRDAWFIGYTTELITGVWVGNDNNAPTKKVTGGLIPVDIWRGVMEPAHHGLTPQPLPGHSEYAAAQPATISDLLFDQGAAVEDTVLPSQQERRSTQNGGFFGRLFGRSGDSSSKGNGSGAPAVEKATSKLSPYERMLRAQEQR